MIFLVMTQKERYNKICELVDITDEIRDKIWNIVYEPQEGDFKNHFDNLHKAEKVAIIGILNDASRLASSITNYQHWFEEK